MSDRKQTTYNAILGINGEGEIVILDYIFEHSATFKGATGTTIRPVYADEIEAAREDTDEIEAYYQEIWQESVAAGNTTDGLSEWVENSIDVDEYINSRWEEFQDIECGDIIDALHDAGLWDPQEEERPVRFEVRSGGRIFPRALDQGEFRWVPAARENLLPLITAAESDA